MRDHKHCSGKKIVVVELVGKFHSYTKRVGLNNITREDAIVPDCNDPSRSPNRRKKKAKELSCLGQNFLRYMGSKFSLFVSWR